MRRLAPVLFCLLAAASLRAQDAPRAWRSGGLDALEERLAASGDTVWVLNFWATWCGPCIAEMPVLDAFAEARAGQPVRVLFVSVDAPSRAERALGAFLAGPHAPRGEVWHLDEAKPHAYIDRVEPDWSGSIPATLVRGAAPQPRAFHEGELDAAALDALFAQYRNP
jgi:thiol-disulfide isomerase/thioredoxin